MEFWLFLHVVIFDWVRVFFLMEIIDEVMRQMKRKYKGQSDEKISRASN